MTRPTPDLAQMHAQARAARLRRADDLLTRDLCLRLRLAIADPSQGCVPGLTVAEAMGPAT